MLGLGVGAEYDYREIAGRNFWSDGTSLYPVCSGGNKSIYILNFIKYREKVNFTVFYFIFLKRN